jgi:hypothetical protein
VSVTAALAHIATAEAALAKVTIGYSLWEQRVASGYYKDVKITNWWQGLNELKLAKNELAAVSQPKKAAAGLVYLFGDKES